MTRPNATIDGNEAAANVAYLASEVVAIYPITPASPMGELADAWAAAGQANLWGAIPQVVEMQSEAGAAGAIHGALQAGALATTFTASQGLLLMLPNMFKIAGELTSTVFHIAARTVATHALSIFGDHSDVMAARSTGWAMLASASVQEAQDLAMVAQMATLASRVPFLHFFDGFRTSHELNRIELLEAEDLRALLDESLIEAHRQRALNPDRPVLRGSAQNPDVFFQAREACNPFYQAVPSLVEQAMGRFADRTGRRYRIFEYHGAPDADRVVVLMGSGVGAAREAVEALVQKGERVGLLQVRLYRPFDAAAFVAALPSSTRSLAVLDRTKEPGATGEPLYLDTLAALVEEWPGQRPGAPLPHVIGGRYGLSSKEFTPPMVAAVLAELKGTSPKRHFTVGIVDDVTHTSLRYDASWLPESPAVTRAVFYGLGADGTVSATKNSVKIIGDYTPLHAQGYFVYDSKKSGSITVSHLRIGAKPIHSSYLIRQASFVACHQFNFLEKLDVLELAEPGATFLLNSPYPASEVWEQLPLEVQEQLLERRLKFYVIDAVKVATEAGLGGRINTVMQACFFALSKVLPVDEAIGHIKEAVRKSYQKLGEAMIRRNDAAIDGALAGLAEVPLPSQVRGTLRRHPPVPSQAPEFVQRVTGIILAGKGDLLPVSAMPPDGTFPVGTARWEKRSIAAEIPIWDAQICTDCGLCALVCPHAAIRMKAYTPPALEGAPKTFPTKAWRGKEFPAGTQLTVQVAPDDCTGCGVCVDVCPSRSKEVARHKAINMAPKPEHLETERRNFAFFMQLPEMDRTVPALDTVKGSQVLEPLFEYSGACAGCGETPYLKLLTQLFGQRLLVANATGCSSIYGGNLPTTPWSAGRDGRGPAWANSLFEDNAEFGLGMRLGVDHQKELAQKLVGDLKGQLGEHVAAELLLAEQRTEEQLARQHERVQQLKERLRTISHPAARRLLAVADALVERSVWIIGGDGWAYDIGFGGLDHVLASGRNVNILVLDTEVYSNTGGQASKATPRGAIAKFAASGKTSGKKDLGMIAMAYGDVYVGQIAIGANPRQTIRAMLEAEAYPGTSLLIAYSTCIAHGIDMSKSMAHMQSAVKSGYWPLYRFVPRFEGEGAPFQLDSRDPDLSFSEFAREEARFAMLERSRPGHARRLMDLAQQDIDQRWRLYRQLAGVERTVPRAEEEEVRE
ncbi:MAG: pyruvate:ferredoxin (flavodoxin) oxidoreductase [Deltaproteobacteria bacterium]|nr:pyruvate:ferredoxin (flavodoxin) oxidoreductase [Deltaproteobacteria bacterium]